MNMNLSLKKALMGATALAVFLSAGLSVSNPAHASAKTVSPTSVAASAVSNSAKLEQVLALAQSLAGKVTYGYGVNNPAQNIFDCSSFTKYVFGSQGVKLIWGATAQSKQGVPVSMSDLKRGDLMFFTVGSSASIGHVGIYLGDGKFIHCTIGPKVNGVIISDFNTSYQNRFVSAARVL